MGDEQTTTNGTNWTDRLPTVERVRRVAAAGEISPVWIAVALVAFFPLGLYFVWKHPGWPTKTKGIWTGAWAVSFVLGLWLIAPLLIFLTLLGAFGIALYLIWQSKTLDLKTKKAATGAAVGVFLVCVVVEIVVFSIRGYNADQEEQRKRYAEQSERDREKEQQRRELLQNKLIEGNEAWAAGDKGKAVGLYRESIELGMPRGSETSTVYQRVIEYDVQTGNLSSAKQLIRKARYRGWIELAFTDPKCNELLKEVETQLAEEKRAEAEMTAGAGTFKLPNSFSLPDGSRVTTNNATNAEKAIGLLQLRMTPDQVKAVLGEPNRVTTNRFGDKMWHYRYISGDKTQILVGFPGKGENAGVLGILIIDGKEMLVGKNDYRKQGGGVDVGDVTGW